MKRVTLRLALEVTYDNVESADDLQELRNNLLDVPSYLMRNMETLTDGTDARIVVIDSELSQKIYGLEKKP